MYYVYVLLSEKDNRHYIGYSSDIKARIESHLKGLVKATKNRLPLKLIYYEAFNKKEDALRRIIFKNRKRKR